MDTNPLDVSAIITIVGTLVTVIGACLTIFKAIPELRKIKVETLKLAADEKSSIANAAESLASGTTMINAPLLKRIRELENQEKKWDEINSARERDWNAQFIRLREDFEHKFEELNQKLQDYMNWAERLTYQLRSYGKDPVPFIPNRGKPTHHAAKLP